jgi:membrane fusion protein (multidrug efflux system)
MKTKTFLWLATGAGLFVIIGSLVGVKAGQIGSMINAGKSFVPPPESVTSTKVEASTWQPTKAAIGSVVAVHGVSLGAELGGLVRSVDFDSGTAVKQGDVLVRLDTSTEEAQLASAQAESTLARLNLERAVSLRQSDANSPADLEAAQARRQQADAAVASLHANIAKKIIRAPFDGRIAIRQVERGQVLSPGTPLASLQSVDPIYVEFWLEQQALAALRLGQPAVVRTDIYPGQTWTAKVSTINSEVDVATRSVRVRATVANADGRLRPGMFVNVEVVQPEQHSVLAIPATAVIYAPYGDSVFVLDEKKDAQGDITTTARQQFVRLGERRGDWVAVASGLTAGQTIVGSGAFKLRSGARVAIKNDLAPKPELTPDPTDK